jgi:hypothetical protein
VSEDDNHPGRSTRDSSERPMKNQAKCYPASPSVQVVGKLLSVKQGGFVRDMSASKVSLTLNHGDHHQHWKSYLRPTLMALVEDELVSLDPATGPHGKPITLTDGRTLWSQVMSR